VDLRKIFCGITLFGAVLSIAAIGLSFKNNLSWNSPFFAMNVNTYLGPRGKTAQKLVKIQLVIKDDPKPAGLQIESVTFNGKRVPLKPRDIHGFRGQGSFQLSPGKYSLKWTAQRDDFVWPRILSFEEEVLIDSRDLWLQISIVGDKASID
jgi:hypothetical protein